MFPVILYDINRKQITTNTIAVIGTNYYLYSPTVFKIEILKNKAYNASIYSIHVDSNNKVRTVNADEHSDNFGYTIVFNLDDKYKYGVTESIDVRISNNSGYSKDYTFILIDETKLPEHYSDIIINNNLPTLEELEPASKNKRELIKRLLLDFKHILRSKGTIESINKFFQFIGFNEKQIKVLEEFYVLDKDNNEIKKVFNPDKTKDVKSGNYSVLYNNWKLTEDGNNNILDSKNLPIHKFASENLDDLIDTLKYAIPLANKYFTVIEQDINFFGINFASNIYQFQSVTSWINQVFVTDVFGFRKKMNINFFTKQQVSETKIYKHMLVENCIQKNLEAYKTEIKYLKSSVYQQTNYNLFIIDSELDDKEIHEFNDFSRCFGACINGEIKSPNTYIGYQIKHDTDTNIQLNINPVWCSDTLNFAFITRLTGLFHIQVIVIDTYGNRETYQYKYNVSSKQARIDFDIYSTVNFQENENNFDLDISSGSVTNSQNENYILGLDTIPDTLDKYFSIGSNDALRYITQASTKRFKNNPLYFIESINKNIKVNDCTEIPLMYTEQYLEFSIFTEYDVSDILNKINQYNSIFDIESDSKPEALQFDKLFISKLNISGYDKELLFLCSTETGIDLKFLYPDIFENQPIYRIPVNYDFPLFSNIENNGIVYKPENCYQITVENLQLPVVRSFFPRMGLIHLPELKQGDTIVVRLNSDYVIDEINPTWTVKNSFNGEVLFTTTDYTLKYRVNENCSYDIEVNFEIYDIKYQINKPGILTSYILKT